LNASYGLLGNYVSPFSHLSVALETSKTLGVPPNLIAKYVPLKSGNWNCLDGSKQIPWDFVNDDSCDCPDGSDEPGREFQLNDDEDELKAIFNLFQGTGACLNTTFYCRNEGHIGATIPSSRVNDGLCGAHYYPLSSTAFLFSLAEKECCDGSDERPGFCPNLCKEIGDIYQQQRNKGAKDTKDGHYTHLINCF
jgi:protein kinase C substrate 80K-H